MKKTLSLLVCVLLLAGLVAIYFYTGNKNKEKETSQPTPAPSTSISLIDHKREDLIKATITTEKHSLTILSKLIPNPETSQDDFKWVVEGVEDLKIDPNKISDLMRGIYTTIVTEKVMDKVDKPEDFGLDKPSATIVAEFNDNTTRTITVGMQDPTRSYYYLMVDGDPALYLMNSYTGDRYTYTINDMLDKTIPTMVSENLRYVRIARKDKLDIELDYDGTEEEKQSDLEEYGAIPLTMKSPYPGRELYTNNFKTNILDSLEGLTYGELVEAKPSDLLKYGLDKPTLDIKITDADNDLHILVGSDAGDGNVYCKPADEDIVYTMEKSSFDKFYNANPLTFVERFVALVNINECDAIIIEAEDFKTNIQIGHEKETTSDGRELDVVKATVDGKAVQEKAFKNYYQSVIGIAYDSEIKDFDESVNAEPYMTVSYVMNTGKPNAIVRLYPYNNDFYALKRDDNPVQFVSNKQSVDLMKKMHADLLAGKLDE